MIAHTCLQGIKYICTLTQLQLMNPSLSILTILILSYINLLESYDTCPIVSAHFLIPAMNFHHSSICYTTFVYQNYHTLNLQNKLSGISLPMNLTKDYFYSCCLPYSLRMNNIKRNYNQHEYDEGKNNNRLLTYFL